jgi:hypothetical protein
MVLRRTAKSGSASEWEALKRAAFDLGGRMINHPYSLPADCRSDDQEIHPVLRSIPFISVFTRTRHWFLSWARWNQFTPPLSICTSTSTLGHASDLFHTKYPTKILCTVLNSPMYHMFQGPPQLRSHHCICTSYTEFTLGLLCDSVVKAICRSASWSFPYPLLRRTLRYDLKQTVVLKFS